MATNAISAPNKMLEEFHHFPKAPVEVRLRIWRYAIEIGTIHLFTDHRKKAWTTKVSSNIILLAVNQEAQQEVLRLYEAPSNKDSVLPLPNGASLVPVGELYFNWDFGLIYIDVRRLRSRDRPYIPRGWSREPFRYFFPSMFDTKIDTGKTLKRLALYDRSFRATIRPGHT